MAAAKEDLGRVAAARGDWAAAEGLLHEVLAIRVQHDFAAQVPPALDALAEVAAGLESYEETARTLGVAQGARERLGMARWAPDEPRCRELADLARHALGAERYVDVFEEGRALSLEEAVAWIRRARGERKRPSRGWESLTPTELRVVELTAEGLTNPQIAERMFISRGTVKVHLSHIFAKVGANTRAELAAEATRRYMRERA